MSRGWERSHPVTSGRNCNGVSREDERTDLLGPLSVTPLVARLTRTG